jgi:hypothetical protein
MVKRENGCDRLQEIKIKQIKQIFLTKSWGSVALYDFLLTPWHFTCSLNACVQANTLASFKISPLTISKCIDNSVLCTEKIKWLYG